MAFFLIVLAGVLAYANSFQGVFLFDDWTIIDSPHVHRLWPLGEVLGATNRPTLDLTIALNYVLGGLDPWGYHFFNLAVHLTAGLFLFLILRATFASTRLPALYRNNSALLATAVSLVWTVHPLTTSAVTYVIQRAESLMGLFYLATIYAGIRFIRTGKKAWSGLAIASSLLGLGTKEVMATAPFLIILYDRIFWADSWRQIHSRRRGHYAALLATLLLPAILLTRTAGYRATAGFGLKSFTALEYSRTQPMVILRYLRLALFPDALCLDYQWPVSRQFPGIFFPLLALAGIILVWARVGRRHPAFGYLGMWFFGILSVTSSFIPIQDIAFEHRMYLPLIAVVAAVVPGLFKLAAVLMKGAAGQKFLFAAIVAVIAAGLGGLTFARNKDYASAVAMWQDVIAKRPDNLRAYNDLGLSLIRAGRPEDARPYLNEALRRNPGYVIPYNNLALSFINTRAWPEAEGLLQKALRLKPDYAEAHNNLGLVYGERGMLQEAAREFEQAARIDPDYAEPYNNLAVIFMKKGEYAKAAGYCRQAVRLKPHYATAYNNLGVIAIYQNDWPAAEQYLEKALALEPNYAKALNNYGVALKAQGRLAEAREYFSRALRLSPEYEEAKRNLVDIDRTRGY